MPADLSSLEGLSLEEKLELLELLEIKDRRKRENWLKHYRPYAKQREFHEAGALFRERLFMAGNQLGKTISGAAELAMHVTGLYPDWWQGKVFRRPTRWIVGSESAELTRKGIQRNLLGPPEKREEWGTGAIPKSHVVNWSMKPGVPDAVASVTVKNEYGGESVIQFNSYDQGRMQHVDNKVLTPTGWRRIGDLRPGDEIIAGDGSVTLVEGVFSHGVKDLYELTFDSGVKTLAGEEHLWLLGERTRGRFMVRTTADLIERYGDQGERPPANRQVSMPNVGVVQLAAQRVPLDPYLVGALLGDGCLRGDRIRFTSADAEIVERVRAGAAQDGAELVSWGGIQYGFKNANQLRGGLELLGMMGLPAHEKSVPAVYLWNTPGVRLEVLRGLMDTDGTVSKKGSLGFATTSSALAEDVSFLIRSFGGKATIRRVEKGRKRPLYKLSLRMPGPTPFHLARKAERCVRPQAETHRHLLRHIRKVEPGEAVCIAVAHPSRLYVTDDFIVTHNTKWQADTLDGVWMDEEPPMDIYTEALTRTNAVGGPMYVTFTPLLGMSQVVKRFLKDKPDGTVVVSMTIDDVEHYTPEQRAAIIAAYPEHEREARARGIPMMGSGMVFPVAESMVSCEPFPIPPHWARICGIDFGIDHPAAFACLAHDRDTDTVYLYDGWRLKGKSAAEQAMVILAKGYARMPWAWPHDGLHRDKGAGTQLVKQYKDFGLNMLAERAQFDTTSDGKAGGHSVEAGVSMMLERMQTRRFRVFSTVTDFFEEMRQYHRKDGVIVKEDDDLLSATRYALMMLRKARTANELAELAPKPNLLLGGGMNGPSFGVLDEMAGY